MPLRGIILAGLSLKTNRFAIIVADGRQHRISENAKKHTGLQRTTHEFKEPPREFKEPPREFKEPPRISKNHPGLQRTIHYFKEPFELGHHEMGLVREAIQQLNPGRSIQETHGSLKSRPCLASFIWLWFFEVVWPGKKFGQAPRAQMGL
jgi:hypothetical protein